MAFAQHEVWRGMGFPPAVITRERSLQELILRMIERQIQHCLLGPRPRRMIHRMTTPCGRGRIAISIGSVLPHHAGDQWKPKLRQDGEMSSVAGDASDASAATRRLKSIYESEGDAVKGSRNDAGYCGNAICSLLCYIERHS